MDYLTSWQKVIFRNYGAVKPAVIGDIIGLNEEGVTVNAEKLGLGGIKYDPVRKEKGFVTVIRNNWDLLPNDKIAELLEIDERALDTLLIEYDFLDVKLGKKPKIRDFSYRPLTCAEEENAKGVKKTVESLFIKDGVRPFDFFAGYETPSYFKGVKPSISDRFASSYSAKYSGALLDDELSDYPNEYLEKLAATGTNGIWLSDALRNLAAFPFDESLSPDYNVRVRNLKKLTERCDKYGIKVYLYLNEPRSLSESFFLKYPRLKGQKADDGTYCLCTSTKEVQDYLYNAVKSLAESVPKLYAVMTITMSENPTHCYSRPWSGFDGIATDCPHCKGRKPQEIVAEINNIIAKGLKDGNGNTKLIANIWGWANYAGADKGEVFETIDLLHKDIEVLCVSEYGKEFTRGGVKGKVDDYSISVGGPSDFAVRVLTYAKEKGHRIWAKIQTNNSWECSAVPYIPTFGLMASHVKRLEKLNVDGLMLGWSLGGYPGGALPLINSLCENGDLNEKVWFDKVFGKDADKITAAVKIFDDAFISYPFSVESIYFGAHNLGPGNLWSRKKDETESSMVCFTFDDLDKWTYPYRTDTYISLMQTLCLKWEKGLDILDGSSKNRSAEEFRRCSLAAFIHFKSALNLATFSKYKSDAKKNADILKACVDDELKLTEKLYGLIKEDARIGFEMTNHYYYDENRLLEKIVCLLNIRESL